LPEMAAGHLAAATRLDEQMRRAVMNYGGLLANFNEALQGLPSWASLGRDLLGISDAHFDDGADVRVHDPVVSGPVEHAIAGATITRSIPRAPKPSHADRVRGG
jgi:hypothetical protein